MKKAMKKNQKALIRHNLIYEKLNVDNDTLMEKLSGELRWFLDEK